MRNEALSQLVGLKDLRFVVWSKTRFATISPEVEEIEKEVITEI